MRRASLPGPAGIGRVRCAPRGAKPYFFDIQTIIVGIKEGVGAELVVSTPLLRMAIAHSGADLPPWIGAVPTDAKQSFGAIASGTATLTFRHIARLIDRFAGRLKMGRSTAAEYQCHRAVLSIKITSGLFYGMTGARILSLIFHTFEILTATTLAGLRGGTRIGTRTAVLEVGLQIEIIANTGIKDALIILAGRSLGALSTHNISILSTPIVDVYRTTFVVSFDFVEGEIT